MGVAAADPHEPAAAVAAAPPAPPPPLEAAAPPLPPLAPPSNATAYRTWHPRTERGEVPTTDENGEFAVTCGIGSCDFSAAVFSGSQMQALDVAAGLRERTITDRSLCPWECVPTLHSHRVPTAYLESQILAGFGLFGILYPGEAEGGSAKIPYSAGGDPMTPTYFSQGDTQLACQTECAARRYTGCQHALFLPDTTYSSVVRLPAATASSGGAYVTKAPDTAYYCANHQAIGCRHLDADADYSSDSACPFGAGRVYCTNVVTTSGRDVYPSWSARAGDCMHFQATRTRAQARLWTSFFQYFSAVTSLAHVTSVTAASLSTTDYPPSDTETACVNSCLWWHEFDNDDYACLPDVTASNVITPTVLLEAVGASGVHYPSPNPPPPAGPDPPHAPSPPPPPPAQCVLGDAYRNIAQQYNVANYYMACYLWNTWSDWPPEFAHQSRKVPATCTTDATVWPAGPMSRVVQWEAGFRQPGYGLGSQVYQSFLSAPYDGRDWLTDETTRPTGPVFQECKDAPPDHECCRVKVTFTYRDMGTSDPNKWSSDLRGNGAVPCEERCSHYGRTSPNGQCMPFMSECEDAQWKATYYDNSTSSTPTPKNGDTGVVTLAAWCLCNSEIQVGVAGRRLLDAEEPPPPEGRQHALRRAALVDAAGGHVTADDQCFNDLYDFRTDLLEWQTNVCEYVELTQPPISVWDTTRTSGFSMCSDLSTTDDAKKSCCLLARGAGVRSTVYLGRTSAGSCAGDYTEGSTRGTVCCGQATTSGQVVAQADHTCPVDTPKCSGYVSNAEWGSCTGFDKSFIGSVATSGVGFDVGLINNDAHVDIIVGNLVYFGDGTGDFEHAPHLQLGGEELKFVKIVQVDGGDGLDVLTIDVVGQKRLYTQVPDEYNDGETVFEMQEFGTVMEDTRALDVTQGGHHGGAGYRLHCSHPRLSGIVAINSGSESRIYFPAPGTCGRSTSARGGAPTYSGFSYELNKDGVVAGRKGAWIKWPDGATADDWLVVATGSGEGLAYMTETAGFGVSHFANDDRPAKAEVALKTAPSVAEFRATYGELEAAAVAASAPSLKTQTALCSTECDEELNDGDVLDNQVYGYLHSADGCCEDGGTPTGNPYQCRLAARDPRRDRGFPSSTFRCELGTDCLDCGVREQLTGSDSAAFVAVANRDGKDVVVAVPVVRRMKTPACTNTCPYHEVARLSLGDVEVCADGGASGIVDTANIHLLTSTSNFDAVNFPDVPSGHIPDESQRCDSGTSCAYCGSRLPTYDYELDWMGAVPIQLAGSDGVSNDVVIDDVDGDGHNDVVVATESGPNRIYYGHPQTTLALADMGVTAGRDHMFGTWSGADVLELDSDDRGNTVGIRVADLNGDGVKDVVAHNVGAASACAARCHAAGRFGYDSFGVHALDAALGLNNNHFACTPSDNDCSGGEDVTEDQCEARGCCYQESGQGPRCSHHAPSSFATDSAYCMCGPHYDVLKAPYPPPAPPDAPPGRQPSPPPPPRRRARAAGPPFPLVRPHGFCVLHAEYAAQSNTHTHTHAHTRANDRAPPPLLRGARSRRVASLPPRAARRARPSRRRACRRRRAAALPAVAEPAAPAAAAATAPAAAQPAAQAAAAAAPAAGAAAGGARLAAAGAVAQHATHRHRRLLARHLL